MDSVRPALDNGDHKQEVSPEVNSPEVNVNMEIVPDSSSSSSITPADDEQVIPGLNENDIVERASFQGPYDSLVVESGKQSYKVEGPSWGVVLQLAFQSIGVVYGDIGTSPLYVYASTFSNGIKHEDDVLGVLSLIVYTLTLIPLLKYVFIVLQANNNGDGGTFALYSLICRYARVGLIPSQQAEDSLVSNFQLELPSKQLERGSRLKSMLEKSVSAKYILLFATMLGTAMVIGDGILTPCISVLSAVGGIKQASESMTQEMVVWTSVGILIVLFSVQRVGADKVGYCFAPIICIWFLLIASIGCYNIVKYDPTVLKALNPEYMVGYFRRNKKEAWISLGGVVLATTGTEALFADVGHFTVRSIQISMCFVTYPALLLAYTGQAAFLAKHPDLVSEVFYKSIPEGWFWPVLLVAILASIIASQAMISGTFAIIQQSLSLGCFPRVKIVHTSSKFAGQVYIPEVNYLLMLACIGVTLGFQSTAKIGNAYGIAVVFVMTLTSAFLVLIMLMIWQTNILLVIAFVLTIGSVEIVYLSSVLYKFNQGGYLPLAFAAALMAIMYVWNDVHRRKYYYELNHREDIAVEALHMSRLPGLALFYSEIEQGIPPIFSHYKANVPALHSILVFVTIKSLPVGRVQVEERFVFSRVNPHELNIFQCIARYGYADVWNEEEEEDTFEAMLVKKLKNFIVENYWFDSEVEKDLAVVNQAWEAGIVHLVGESEVIAAKGAGVLKRILIDYAYDFLKKNVRKAENVFDIPHKRMLKVGMTYEL